MYKRILVTLDGSPSSEAVLPQVERLVAGTDARITLLTVAEYPEPIVDQAPEPEQTLVLVATKAPTVRAGPQPVRYAETVDQAYERVKEEMERYLEQKAHPLRAKGMAVETVVRFGDPALVILEYARTHDLIMMASHGRTGLARLIFGSVAGRILERGLKPVLVVRPDNLKKEG